MLNRPLNYLSLGVLALASVGCTHTAKMRVAPEARIGATAAAKLPLHICLLLEPAYREFQYSFESMGDKWVFPFGEAAQDQAISLCEQTFERVTVVTNGLIPQGVDAVLDPEVQRVGYAVGPGSKLSFVMNVEWTLRDATNQKILWVHTVDGRAVAKRKAVYQELFDDLAAKSHVAMTRSPELEWKLKRRVE